MLAVAIRDTGQAGRVLLVEAATGTVRWDVISYTKQASSATTRVAMSSDGRFVASVSNSEENWKLWDAASGAAWMTGAKRRNRSVRLRSVEEDGTGSG